MGLVVRAILRELARHPWQLALTLFSIAIGVTVIVGVDIANQSALREFRQATQIMDGQATHRIAAVSGYLDERLYRRIKVDAEIQNATPVISAQVRLTGSDVRWTLLGIDPLSDFRIRQLGLLDHTPSVAAPSEWPIYVPGSMIRGNEINQLPVSFGDAEQVFTIAGVIDSDAETSAASKRLLITDISWAQEFLQLNGRISHIDLKLGANEAQTLIALLPSSVNLIDLLLVNNAQEDMTRAFRINLTALGLLAMLVAAFLIYSIISFQVVRRRQLMGTLRMAGVSSRQLAVVLLTEVVAVGLVGSLLGVALGVLLGNFLGAMVSGIVNSLYYALAEPKSYLSGFTLFKAILAGIGVTVFAAVVPILIGTRMNVAEIRVSSVQQARTLKSASCLFPISMLLACIGAALIWWSGTLISAFAGLFILICALALLGPWIIHWMCRFLSRLRLNRISLLPKLALANAGIHLGRTGVAVVALSVAVSATIGVALMIDSFRFSITEWLENYLRADIYLAVSGTANTDLSESLVRQLELLPAVEAISVGKRHSLASSTGPLTVFMVSLPQRGFSGYQIQDSLGGDLWQRFHNQGQVLITEPLSRRLKLHSGDQITLPTEQGPIAFTIAAVYQDYSSDRGLVTMDRKTWGQYFTDLSLSAVGLYLHQDSKGELVLEQIKALDGMSDTIFVRSNKMLRQLTLAVFDKTFRVTDSLRWLALLVAVVGIVSSLMALQLERRREYAAFAATGFTRSQLAWMLVIETLFVGFVAGLVAIPVGIALSAILIEVINLRSFGWSMQFLIDPIVIWQSLLLAVFAAAAASIYPVWKLFRMELAEALRND